MSDENYSELEDGLPGPNDPEGECFDPVMKPFNPTDIDIVVEPKSLDALIERIRHKDIDMNTDFQRHAELWDNAKMSRLIESILIRFPLPAFYFDASEDNNWLIVDGLQRLSSIRKFVIDKKLKLSGLEFLTDLNGKNYDGLHRIYQRRIKECPVTVYLIKPGTPPEVKYSIFRRINTGGMTLNNQEIRNAMAKPAERKLLKDLATHRFMIATLGDVSKRMGDQELVLRFWAFYKFDYFDKNNKKAIALFLDKAMDDIKSGDENYRENLKQIFEKAISRCYHLLGKQAFEKEPANNGARKRKNTTLFEVWMVSLAKLEDNEISCIENNMSIFKAKIKALSEDTDFLNAVTYATQKEDHVRIRYERIRKLIDEVIHA
ncbi:FIG01098778: hypothetical protein [hydrothermal vent metagenome]|uniref:GmrSD restriction endonucleases N-terminal domain-containing protein n=1 Tax=hydrothermal vent metagenome TaxID=652676 RepID=A0A3B0VS76_9ZZZZ